MKAIEKPITTRLIQTTQDILHDAARIVRIICLEAECRQMKTRLQILCRIARWQHRRNV